MKNLILLIIAISLLLSCESTIQHEDQKQRQGEYLGEALPGDTPQIFAPEFISTGIYTRDITISPDGDELFFSVAFGGRAFIMETHQENNSWTTPKVASFSGSDEWLDFEPHISPDGNRFFMLSTRPPKGKEPKPGWGYQNIWAMDKTENGWSALYNLGEPICTEANEYYATATLAGNLYFTRSTGRNNSAIWRSKMIDGKYSRPEKLIFNNDTSLFLFNSFIAPDESYLIVCANNLNDSINVSQYCVSFRSDEDEWSELIPFDERLNYPGDRASSVFVTHDMNYMFFASSRTSNSLIQPAPGVSINQLLSNLTKPGNGQSDIYWISAKIIDELKPLE